VKTICKLTGINEHTLRAWERRYQVVEPERLENGRRVYSLDDLEKLKLITKLLQNGFLIGHIASYSRHELAQLWYETGSQGPTTATRHLSEVLKSCEQALTTLAVDDLFARFERIKVEHGIREFLFHLLQPLQVRVKECLEQGEMTTVHHQLFDTVARSHLLSILFNLNSRRVTTEFRSRAFLVANIGNALAEIDQLCAAVICAINEYQVVYLGGRLRAGELAETLRNLKLNTLVLGLPPDEETAVRDFLGELERSITGRCEFWLMGSRLAEPPPGLVHPTKTISSVEELDQTLLSVR
jgi:DNA-binding transcriptional MerR regulator